MSLLKLESYHIVDDDMILENYRETPSIMWFISRVFNRNTLYNDRFDVFPKSEYEWNSSNLNESIDDIYNEKSLSLEECCYNRVCEIMNYASSIGKKDIYISWSGGVDSTLAVCSFLLCDSFDIKNLHILYNESSISEYPYFYKLLAEQNIHMHNFYNNCYMYENFAGDNIVVNGHGGDYIIPSNLFSVQYNFNDWKLGIQYFCKLYSYKNVEYYIENIKKYIEYYNLDIKTFPELGWILCFGTLWHRNMEYKKLISKFPKRRLSFYNTLYFQKFALNRFYNIKRTLCSNGIMYKSDMKKIIKKYTKDDNYVLNKGKNYNKLFISDKKILGIKDSEGYKLLEDSSIQYIIDNYIKEEYKDCICSYNIMRK